MTHVHEWIFTDLGGHWCKFQEECEIEFHDFPCDHPEDHAGEDSPPPGSLKLVPREAEAKRRES